MAVIKLLFNYIVTSIGWCQSKKGILLIDQLLALVLQWLSNDCSCFVKKQGRMVKLFMCKHWYNYQRKAGNENDDLLLQTLTSPAIKANISSPSFASAPIQPQFLTQRLRTSPPYRGQLENSMLVSEALGLGLISPSKSQQGTQFGPRATFQTWKFPLRQYLLGGLKANN